MDDRSVLVMLQCLRNQVAQLKLDYSDKVRQSKIDNIIEGIDGAMTETSTSLLVAMKSVNEHFPIRDLAN